MFEKSRAHIQQHIQKLDASAKAADELYTRAEEPRRTWDQTGKVIDNTINPELKRWQQRLKELPAPVDLVQHNDLTVQILHLRGAADFARVTQLNLSKQAYIRYRQSRNLLRRTSTWVLEHTRSFLKRISAWALEQTRNLISRIRRH